MLRKTLKIVCLRESTKRNNKPKKEWTYSLKRHLFNPKWENNKSDERRRRKSIRVVQKKVRLDPNYEFLVSKRRKCWSLSKIGWIIERV